MTNILTAEERRKLEEELTILEEKLKTPSRTEEDLIRHMQILKQLNAIKIS